MHNQCLRKKRFRDFEVASRKAAEHNVKNPPGDGKIFHAYHCPLCFTYHIGRTQKEKS